jgi:hypothetical protein
MLKVKFTDARFNKLADIISNIGLVTFGSVVLPATLDRFNLLMILIGTGLSVILWIMSLWLVKP